MADSISIVMTMTDDISGGLKSISSASKGVNKEYEELKRQAQQLGQRYAELNKRSAETASRALSVKKQMDEARKAFKSTGEEADRVRFASLKAEYDGLTIASKGYSTAAKETVKDMNSIADTVRKMQSGSSGGFFSSLFTGGLGNGLAQSGVIKDLGNSISGAIGAGVTSAIGQPKAEEWSSIFSGAISGISAGAIAGLPGMVAGGIFGTAAGIINAKTKTFEKEDAAFKDYYKGLYETVTQATDEGLTSGKALAASRETDRLAFSTLLGGEGQANRFLGQLIKTADTTPFQYDDLTGVSKTLLSFGYAVEDIIPTMTKVGDAGAALGLSTSDIGTVATYIGRMKSSNKASLEYLNPLMERGFGVFEWLAEDLGISQEAVYKKISKGDLSGSYVSELILEKFSALYSGQMEKQAKTTEGLDSTLEGTLDNIQAAAGEAYNALRNQGKQADIDAYSGELGKAMEKLSGISGENRAYGENMAAQYTREALESVLLGKGTTLDFGAKTEELAALAEEYKYWNRRYNSAVGDENKEGQREAGLNMERIKETAEALATASYESSEWYQKVQDEELTQIDAIRENTKGLEAATTAYILGNAFTKGQGGFDLQTGPIAGDADGNGVLTRAEALAYVNATRYSNAYGLRRVPFSGYPAVLHQDERVLTAAEAREQDRGGRNHLTVNFTGPITVRQDSDLDEIASRLADEIDQARQRAG